MLLSPTGWVENPSHVTEESLCFETLRTLGQSIYRDLEARAEVQDSETRHISTFKDFAPRVIEFGVKQALA
jgi:hypothetical protein